MTLVRTLACCRRARRACAAAVEEAAGAPADFPLHRMLGDFGCAKLSLLVCVLRSDEESIVR